MSIGEKALLEPGRRQVSTVFRPLRRKAKLSILVVYVSKRKRVYLASPNTPGSLPSTPLERFKCN